MKFKAAPQSGMKTVSKFSRVCGWSARCASGVLALAFCASAFATDPGKNVVAQPRVAKICYVKTIASGIPLRCDKYFGAFATTTNPLEVIGRSPEGGAEVGASVALPAGH
jgi:hypothetical protein